jgi:DNA repair protein RadC
MKIINGRYACDHFAILLKSSEADIKVTRDLLRAGQLLKIEVLDHVVMGRPNFMSLRALGYLSV